MLSRFPWFTKFPDRKLEWWVSLHTFGFGLWLAMPGASFTGSRGFDGVNSLMSEGWWSITFLVIGAVHAQSLHINGRGSLDPVLSAGLGVLQRPCVFQSRGRFLDVYAPFVGGLHLQFLCLGGLWNGAGERRA